MDAHDAETSTYVVQQSITYFFFPFSVLVLIVSFNTRFEVVQIDFEH